MNHLIGLEGLSQSELTGLLDRAAEFKAAEGQERGDLKGKLAALLFFEPSTRTRSSFEVAARRLGADVLSISEAGSSLVKGETLEDTLANLEAVGADVFVMRHPDSGAAERASRSAKVPVINAGDGRHEHPTQALLDMFTIRERKGRLRDLKVVIVGDILHSRVARSNMWGLARLGAKVTFCGPPTLMPRGIEKWATVSHRPEEALEGADVVMVLRLQTERQTQGLLPSLGEYKRLYGISKARLARAKPDCLLLHPGPINRGVELESDVADGPQSVILEQVRNGVFVRMAVFAELLRTKGKVS